MLASSLTAFILFAARQAPPAACTLAGPSVEAHWSGAIPPASTAEAPLRVITNVPLPGSASRFDYQSLEPVSGRLFISHMGAGQLVVFDVRAGKVIGNLDGFPTVTGVLAVPSEHRAYASTRWWWWTIRRFASWRGFRDQGSRTGSRMLPRSGVSSSRTNRDGGTF